jgi:lipopolysaccharide/colanic/teichoic acid biosynthesis glycosyltransferase
LADETVSYDADDHGRDALNIAGFVTWSSQHTDRLSGPKQGRQALRPARGVLHAGLKKCIDLTGAGVGLLLLFPLFVVMAVAIKLTSRGPVFFRQWRYGLNGKKFAVLKFRTMYEDQCDSTGISQTVANDPRVTLVGAFLRKSNFDELPQLINVLRGEMSLVGPRPHVPGMLAAGRPYEEFHPRYMDRHSVLPGITGLAQVNGFRGETKDPYSARMRLAYDLAYVERQSVALDVKILATTIVKEFFYASGS